MDEHGVTADKVATLTTKQYRHPNSGNLYLEFNNGKSNFRYLTQRECFILMEFDEEDYDAIINNDISTKKNCSLFPHDKLIRMAGNSIAINVLEAVFKQVMQIKKVVFK